MRIDIIKQHQREIVILVVGGIVVVCLGVGCVGILGIKVVLTVMSGETTEVGLEIIFKLQFSRVHLELVPWLVLPLHSL